MYRNGISRPSHSLNFQHRALHFSNIKAKSQSQFPAPGVAFSDSQGDVTVSISSTGRCFFRISGQCHSLNFQHRALLFSESQGAVTVCFQHQALLLFESQGLPNNIRANNINTKLDPFTIQKKLVSCKMKNEPNNGLNN